MAEIPSIPHQGVDQDSAAKMAKFLAEIDELEDNKEKEIKDKSSEDESCDVDGHYDLITHHTYYWAPKVFINYILSK